MFYLISSRFEASTHLTTYPPDPYLIQPTPSFGTFVHKYGSTLPRSSMFIYRISASHHGIQSSFVLTRVTTRGYLDDLFDVGAVEVLTVLQSIHTMSTGCQAGIRD